MLSTSPTCPMSIKPSAASLLFTSIFSPGSIHRRCRSSNGAASVLVDEIDDLLVDLPAQHHFHDIERLRRSPASLYEFALLAKLLQQLVYLWSAPVHYDRIHPHELEQHDIAREAL